MPRGTCDIPCQEFSLSLTNFTWFNSGHAQSAAGSLNALGFNSCVGGSWFTASNGYMVLDAQNCSLQLVKPVVCQQGSAGCLGIAAVWDSPYSLLEKASRLWLQMSQLWWKRVGGENAILSRMACLFKSVGTGQKGRLLLLLLLKHSQWGTPAALATYRDVHKKLWLWRGSVFTCLHG